MEKTEERQTILDFVEFRIEFFALTISPYLLHVLTLPLFHTHLGMVAGQRGHSPQNRKNRQMKNVDRKYHAGDIVKLREGSALYRQRYAKRKMHGIVIEAQDIGGYGYAIKVQWPNEPAPPSFQLADLFDQTE